MDKETFTDFMIRCMETEHDVQQAAVIVRRGDNSFEYRTFNQDVMDMLGMLRFTAMSVEHDAAEMWKDAD